VGWLLSIYIAATVFGVGVTAIDLLGLIGDHGSEGDHADGHDGDAGHAIGHDGHADDGDFGGHIDDGGDAADFGHVDDAGDEFDAGGADHGDGDFGHDAGHDDGGVDHDGDHELEAVEHTSVAGHDTRRRNPILRILSTLRSMVYFALGFGPTGWFALGTGQGTVPALLWSGGVGLVVLFGVRGLRKVLRSELNSEVSDSDLLMEKGTVTVSVQPNQLGRVRIRLGGALVDRYARSKLDKPISPGTEIRVIDIGDDCVFVEPEEE
jgi:membrane protein implicated in regulation of membrane protease activity